MAAFLVYNQRKGIRYMVSRRRILGFAIGKMLRQDGWAEKYNPKNQFHVNQYDYSSCKEYLSALRESGKIMRILNVSLRIMWMYLNIQIMRSMPMM